MERTEDLAVAPDLAARQRRDVGHGCELLERIVVITPVLAITSVMRRLHQRRDRAGSASAPITSLTVKISTLRLSTVTGTGMPRL